MKKGIPHWRGMLLSKPSGVDAVWCASNLWSVSKTWLIKEELSIVAIQKKIISVGKSGLETDTEIEIEEKAKNK